MLGPKKFCLETNILLNIKFLSAAKISLLYVSKLNPIRSFKYKILEILTTAVVAFSHTNYMCVYVHLPIYPVG